MPRAAPMLSAFNAGELSPNVEGRVEVGKYANGCKTLENYIPLVQGPAKRRGGTRYVAEVKDSSKRTWLVRFEFNTQQAYQLEFGDKYIRFYTNHGQVQVSGVAAYNGATAYVVGNLVSNAGVNYYCIAATTGNAPPNATYWYPLTGTIYEIPTPWAYTDLTASDGTFGLRFVESNDIVYICHQYYAPRKLARYGATNWQITTLTPQNGPFKTVNTTATTVQASAQTGAITLTASTAIFQASHVGSIFYMQQASVLAIAQWEAGKAVGAGMRRRSSGLNYYSLNAATTGGNKPIHTEGAVYDGDTGVQWQFEDPGYGYALITGYTSATQVSATVIKSIPYYASTGGATTKWAFGAWSDVEGWPSQVSFYKERLTFGRGQSVWMSVTGDYENFAPKDDSGTVTASQAITLTLQSDKVNNLQWFASSDSMVCGTAGGEFAIQPITTNQPFGPDNCTAPTVSVFGSRSVLPVRIGDAILFVQRSGIKLRDIIYDYLSNKFNSTDQNVFADHITKGGLLNMVYQQEPYSIVWTTRADGQLVAMTYSREQYENQPFGGWHRHPLGGSFSGGSAVVESLSVIPAPTADRDELWMIVKRTINGATKRYIEYMAPEWKDTDAQADAYYVDCGATYSGAPATTVSGLDWLEGQTVSVLADGAVQPNRTVTGGAITLDVAASKVQVGLPYVTRLQTMRLNAGGADGTSQGKTARINKLVIRFLNSLGLKYGPSFSALDEIDFRTVADGMNAPPALFTGDKILDFDGDYSNDPWVCIQQDNPLPSTIIGIMPTNSTYDRG